MSTSMGATWQGHFGLAVIPKDNVVPSGKIGPLLFNALGGRNVLPSANRRSEGARYREAWALFAG